MSSDVCVLTTFFNPFNSKSRIDNFYIFLESLKKCMNIKNFYVLEILNHNQEEQIKDCNVLRLYNDDLIWQKEAGLNYLVNNIDLSKYSKIITSDCDVFLKDNNWINRTSELLDKYHACQPFKNINYINFDSSEVDQTIDGVVYSYLTKNTHAQYGNGGLIIGYNKEYVNHMNGFFEKAPVGGGDTLNILPFLYNCNFNFTVFDNLMADIKTEYFEYLIKAREHIKNNVKKEPCFFADYTANHLFHGKLSNRQYQLRHSYINKYNYNDNFVKDDLIKFKKDCELKNLIKSYFEDRKEILGHEDPIVWSNIKYEVENIGPDKFLWLSDCNKFIFQNIKEVKMTFEKNQEVNEVKVYNNDTIFLLKFDENNKGELLITDPKKIEIFSDYFIPSSIGENTDSRKLSIMLKKIEIKVNNKYVEYNLKNIL